MAFWTNPEKTLTFSRFPEHQQQMDSLIKQILSELQSNKYDFGPIREAATKRFQEETVPTLAERFSFMGGEGTGRSSGFERTLGEAGAGLQRDLAAMEQGFGQQNLATKLGALDLGGRQSYFVPQSPGWGQTLLGQVLAALGLGAGKYLGG